MKDKIKDIALGLLLATWTVLTPIHTIMFVMCGLVAADFVAGVVRSIYSGTPVTSRRMRHTVGKFLGYQLVLLFGFGMDTIADSENLLCTRTIAVLCGLAEAKSLDEKLQETLGFSVWEALVSKLKPAPKE